jgi:hypothetical protein
VSLRRLGLGPEDVGRMARLCLEHGEVDRDLAPWIADQRAAIARQRDNLDGSTANSSISKGPSQLRVGPAAGRDQCLKRRAWTAMVIW